MPTLYYFDLLTSNVHMSWMKAICVVELMKLYQQLVDAQK